MEKVSTGEFADPSTCDRQVFQGSILDEHAPYPASMGDGAVVFVVLESAPPSHKSALHGASTSAGPSLESQVSSGRRGDGSQSTGDDDEDAVTGMIKELENAVAHLKRSNEELRAAGPDPDFEARKTPLKPSLRVYLSRFTIGCIIN